MIRNISSPLQLRAAAATNHPSHPPLLRRRKQNNTPRQVVDCFMRHWPGPIALVAPLYAPCYDAKLAARLPPPHPPPAPAGARPAAAAASNGGAAGEAGAGDGGSGGGGGGGVAAAVDRPPWIRPEQLLLSLTAAAPSRAMRRVDVFKVEVGRVTYYLVQADSFRARTRGTIYT